MARHFTRVLSHCGLTLLGLAALLALALAGCAAGGLSNPPQPGSPELNGCQTQSAPANLAPADVVLRGAASQSTPTSDFTTQGTMKQGQTLEIRLAATVNWQLTTPPSAAILQVVSPQSWYDGSDQSCVWRMQATSSGSTQMEFTGGLVCPPNQGCPAIAGDARFNITVS